MLFTRVNVSGAQLRTIRAGNQRINAHSAVITSAHLIAAGTPVRPMQFSGRWNGRVGFLFFPTGTQGAGAPFFAFAFPVGDGVAGARVTIGDVLLTELPESVVSADKRRDLLHHEYHRAQQWNYSADRTGGWYAFAILYFLKGSDPWGNKFEQQAGWKGGRYTQCQGAAVSVMRSQDGAPSVAVTWRRLPAPPYHGFHHEGHLRLSRRLTRLFVFPAAGERRPVLLRERRRRCGAPGERRTVPGGQPTR
ncbi:hypothetical protein ACGFIJ_27025 [Microbispora bryophytorum]|uniref:hypothetical protein n=1 Tax=Microbispora bryophytorum TaxID=1460882 RepID=UPI0037118FCC